MASQIQDWAEQEQADLAGIASTLDGIANGVANLEKMITDFQNSPGTLTPTDQAALDKIQATVRDLKAKADAIRTEPPTPTPTP